MKDGNYDVVGGEGGPGRFEIRRVVAHACALLQGALLAQGKNSRAQRF